MARARGTHCLNRKCGEPLSVNQTALEPMRRTFERAGILFCPSCRYMGKWAFTIGAALVGIAWGIAKLLVGGLH